MAIERGGRPDYNKNPPEGTPSAFVDKRGRPIPRTGDKQGGPLEGITKRIGEKVSSWKRKSDVPSSDEITRILEQQRAEGRTPQPDTKFKTPESTDPDEITPRESLKIIVYSMLDEATELLNKRTTSATLAEAHELDTAAGNLLRIADTRPDLAGISAEMGYDPTEEIRTPNVRDVNNVINIVDEFDTMSISDRTRHEADPRIGRILPGEIQGIHHVTDAYLRSLNEEE